MILITLIFINPIFWSKIKITEPWVWIFSSRINGWDAQGLIDLNIAFHKNIFNRNLRGLPTLYGFWAKSLSEILYVIASFISVIDLKKMRVLNSSLYISGRFETYQVFSDKSRLFSTPRFLFNGILTRGNRKIIH